MPRRTLLELHRACSLQSLLEALVCCTNERQGSHDPQVTALQPVTAEPDELPAFINARDCKVGLIYGADASPSWPVGDVLLWIRFRPVPGRGYEQDGLHYGHVVVHVWQNENYPLSRKEVEWFIADHCGCTSHQWRQLPLCWQALQETCEENLADEEHTLSAEGQPRQENQPEVDDSQESLDDDPSQAEIASERHVAEQASASQQHAKRKATHARRRKSNPHREGKPRLETTRWLQAQIAALPNINGYDHLYSQWLKTYWHETGDPPRNPYNSFKQMADSCVERILAERATT